MINRKFKTFETIARFRKLYEADEMEQDAALEPLNYQETMWELEKNQADMILPENVEVKKIPKDLLDKCNFESEVQE